ncbi:hypothetical protein XU18_0933 [Perkinsela sp. CCAP 1560/4]|nr:hypothetical protein XU18_0933 [Perkinsela sp. CCAP 1560/4]|eukprot:KNH08530.1 hypothetical protein XU18_0933 [Perkinsela sp. CCAP 1560/4]
MRSGLQGPSSQLLCGWSRGSGFRLFSAVLWRSFSPPRHNNGRARCHSVWTEVLHWNLRYNTALQCRMIVPLQKLRTGCAHPGIFITRKPLTMCPLSSIFSTDARRSAKCSIWCWTIASRAFKGGMERSCRIAELEDSTQLLVRCPCRACFQTCGQRHHSSGLRRR